jgi:predicted amidophosphoribosyltransferase
MAAFCACCGAEIKLKAEACPVCGTPRHGMLPPDRQPALDRGQDRSQEDFGVDEKPLRPRL